VASIENGGNPGPDLEDALRALEIVDLIYKKQ
jgi:hypothetical protein